MNTVSLSERVNDTPASPICSFPGCGRPKRCDGLCKTHYSHQRQGRELRPINYSFVQSPVCTFRGCGRPRYGHGLCQSHCKQRREGKTLSPLPADLPKRDRPKRATRRRPKLDRPKLDRPKLDRPKRVCSFPDCGRPHHGRGLCSGHYEQKGTGRELVPLGDARRGRLPRTRITSEKLFWEKTDKSGPCWIFTGALVHGYGQFHLDGKTVRAHRFAWELAYGKIPAGFQTDHLCKVRSCLNVDHLRLVTAAQNNANRRGNPDYSLTDVEGIFWLGKSDGRYRAVLSGSGTSVVVGHYGTFEDAVLALEQARAGWQLPLPGMERLTAAYDGGVL